MKRRRCRGVAAIEAALVLGALTVLLVNALRYGRLAESGAALDRGACNAARYLASQPMENLRDSGRRAAVLARARQMVDDALAAAKLQVTDLDVNFLCDPGPCTSLTQTTAPPTAPGKVGVLATMQYQDGIFSSSVPVSLTVYAEVGRGN